MLVQFLIPVTLPQKKLWYEPTKFWQWQVWQTAAAMWVLQAMYHASFWAADTLKLLPLLWGQSDSGLGFRVSATEYWSFCFPGFAFLPSKFQAQAGLFWWAKEMLWWQHTPNLFHLLFFSVHAPTFIKTGWSQGAPCQNFFLSLLWAVVFFPHFSTLAKLATCWPLFHK